MEPGFSKFDQPYEFKVSHGAVSPPFAFRSDGGFVGVRVLCLGEPHASACLFRRPRAGLCSASLHANMNRGSSVQD